MKDGTRSGRPLISKIEINIKRVWQVVRDDRRLTILRISVQLDMSKGQHLKIFIKDLGMFEK